MDKAGNRFGKYELLEVIGEGGMACVYRAVLSGAMGFRKEVAIKQILPEGLRGDRRNRLAKALINEARAGGCLRHRNVVEMYEFEQIDDVFYIAMEYIHGVTLRDVLDRTTTQGPIPPRIVAQIGEQICAGLAHAHEATTEDGLPLGLIHRDIKPSNVMIGRDGVVKLMDFGIARTEINLFRDTGTAETTGTPQYMSPEQVLGNKLDQRSDLFAVGSILVETITGTPPFQCEPIYKLMNQIARADAVQAIQRVHMRFPSMSPLVAHALRRQPEDRPQSAAQMGSFLGKLARALPGDERLESWIGSWMDGISPEPIADYDPSRYTDDAAPMDTGAATSWHADAMELPGSLTPSPSPLPAYPLSQTTPPEVPPDVPAESSQDDAAPPASRPGSMFVRTVNQPDDPTTDSLMSASDTGSLVPSSLFTMRETKRRMKAITRMAPRALPYGVALLALLTLLAMVRGDSQVSQEASATHGWSQLPDGETPPAARELPPTTALEYRMISLDPGGFLMGSADEDGERQEDETYHTVRITRTFELGATEVTRDLWHNVGMDEDTSGCDDQESGDAMPVACVSWHDAAVFCNRLSLLEGLDPAYRFAEDRVQWLQQANGYRLPTEAEWEYAARGLQTSIYPAPKDEICRFANVENVVGEGGKPWLDAARFECQDGYQHAAPVGSFQPNAWGLHDMSGNVWEWVWDRYAASYGRDAVVDPAGPKVGPYRVARGGSWDSAIPTLRLASRLQLEPVESRSDVGLRLARTVQAP